MAVGGWLLANGWLANVGYLRRSRKVEEPIVRTSNRENYSGFVCREKSDLKISRWPKDLVVAVEEGIPLARLTAEVIFKKD